MTIFATGDTVTIVALYTRKSTGTAYDPDAAPTVTLYASDEVTVIGATGTAAKSSTGTYTYEQTLPKATGAPQYIVEFATTVNGKPKIGREWIQAAFAPS